MENNLREQVIYLGWVLQGCKNLLEDASNEHEIYHGKEGDEIITETVATEDLKPGDKCVTLCAGCRATNLLTWTRGAVPPPDWRKHGMVADDWVPAFMEQKEGKAQ